MPLSEKLTKKLKERKKLEENSILQEKLKKTIDIDFRSLYKNPGKKELLTTLLLEQQKNISYESTVFLMNTFYNHYVSYLFSLFLMTDDVFIKTFWAEQIVQNSEKIIQFIYKNSSKFTESDNEQFKRLIVKYITPINFLDEQYLRLRETMPERSFAFNLRLILISEKFSIANNMVINKEDEIKYRDMLIENSVSNNIAMIELCLTPEIADYEKVGFYIIQSKVLMKKHQSKEGQRYNSLLGHLKYFELISNIDPPLFTKVYNLPTFAISLPKTEEQIKQRCGKKITCFLDFIDEIKEIQQLTKKCNSLSVIAQFEEKYQNLFNNISNGKYQIISKFIECEVKFLYEIEKEIDKIKESLTELENQTNRSTKYFNMLLKEDNKQKKKEKEEDSKEESYQEEKKDSEQKPIAKEQKVKKKKSLYQQSLELLRQEKPDYANAILKLQQLIETNPTREILAKSYLSIAEINYMISLKGYCKNPLEHLYHLNQALESSILMTNKIGHLKEFKDLLDWQVELNKKIEKRFLDTKKQITIKTKQRKCIYKIFGDEIRKKEHHDLSYELFVYEDLQERIQSLLNKTEKNLDILKKITIEKLTFNQDNIKEFIPAEAHQILCAIGSKENLKAPISSILYGGVATSYAFHKYTDKKIPYFDFDLMTSCTPAEIMKALSPFMQKYPHTFFNALPSKSHGEGFLTATFTINDKKLVFDFTTVPEEEFLLKNLTKFSWKRHLTISSFLLSPHYGLMDLTGRGVKDCKDNKMHYLLSPVDDPTILLPPMKFSFWGVQLTPKIQKFWKNKKLINKIPEHKVAAIFKKLPHKAFLHVHEILKKHNYSKLDKVTSDSKKKNA